ncbi:response regulator transcription factor [Eubacterium ruminantium]|uniref:response regulator transcription factor n=1 Tax=Eubacterium ruminantium TaxID=42322 RepID=UPI00247B2309|nr:response regulator [Eubacterium ruminantium]
MLNVMLVDDEPYITQGLSLIIDWEKEGYKIIYIANNGLEAVDYLKSTKETVDLIIADIRMPEMTGIELLEKIREENLSDAYFVVLSGYADFGYVRDAMRNGCVEYMLKPVNKDELLTVLRKLSENRKNDKITEEHLKAADDALLEKNLSRLIKGRFDEENLMWVRENVKLYGRIRYVYIEIYGGGNDEEDEVLQSEQKILFSACKDALPDDEGILLDMAWSSTGYGVGYIFNGDNIDNSGKYTDEEFLDKFLQKIKRSINKPIHLIAGKSVKDISTISKSYSTALILRQQIAFHDTKDIYIYEDEIKVNKANVLLCKKSLDELIKSIDEGDEARIIESVDGFYKEMSNMGVNENTVSLNLNYFLFQLIHLATEQDSEVNQEEILDYISESAFEDGVKRGSKSHLRYFSIEYSKYMSQLRKNVSRGVLQDIENEVKENYAENLSLKELSRKYYINSSYLGQLFRKKYGKSFKDYLTDYRIEEAARLLLKTDKKIINISEEVGYKDSDYFLQKFIERKGCTPSKYRRTYS